MCPPLPSQLFNDCFTRPAISALIIGSIAIVIGLTLSVLIFRAKNKKLPHFALLSFLLSSIVSSPLVGILVVLSPNPDETLLFLRVIVSINAFMIVAWYTFLSSFLKIRNKLTLYISASILIGLSIYLVVFPYSALQGIAWNGSFGWYDFVIKENIISSMLPFIPLFLPHIIGIIYLIAAYKNNRSPIQRNRIKYLAMASGIYMLGWALYMSPIQAFRFIPVDAIAAVISGGIITYTILRLKLLDITVIIRKGLLYTTLTTIVTGIYLLFAFIIETLFGISSRPMSYTSAISTAVVVAFIFQPLQNSTQTIIDKIFFRKRYNSNELISKFSDITTSTIEREDLASSIVELICKTIGIEKAFLSIADTKQEKFLPVYTRSYKDINSLYLEGPHQIIETLLSVQGTIDCFDNSYVTQNQWMKDRNVELIVPMISKDKLIGLIGLGPKLSEQEYTIEEYTLFNSLGGQAAIAFENSNLLETVRLEKKAVEKAYMREKELDKQKSEFVSLASHNLRTPLTIASTYIGTMLSKRERLSKSNQDSLQTVQNALNRLSVITEKLLIITQVETKEEIFTFQKENYLEMIDELVEMYRPIAKEKSLELKYDKPEVSNPTIVLDRAKIKLTLSSLLTNAIKFTESGFVEISVVENSNSLAIKISDTGKGISSENIENLFSMFHQINKTPYEYTSGIGSGLYISKLIVEAHHGKISVESKLGIGSVFSVVIPNNITPTQRNEITSLGTD